MRGHHSNHVKKNSLSCFVGGCVFLEPGCGSGFCAGQLDALLARFRDYTVTLFKKHGMTNVGYWVPVDNKENKLVYMLAFPSREARNKAFKAFSADPDWQKAYKESTKDGRLVKKIVNDFLAGTDFSKIK